MDKPYLLLGLKMTVNKTALDDHFLGDWLDISLDDLPAIHFVIDDESPLTFHLTAIGNIPSGYRSLQDLL